MICTIKLMSKRIYTLHHNASEIGTPDIHRCNRVHKYVTIARVQTSLVCAHAPHTMMMWIVILVSISLLAWFCSRAAAAVACIRWRWRHRTRENKRTHNRTPRASCCIYKYILCTELCDVVGEWKWKIKKKSAAYKNRAAVSSFNWAISSIHCVTDIVCSVRIVCVCVSLGSFHTHWTLCTWWTGRQPVSKPWCIVHRQWPCQLQFFFCCCCLTALCGVAPQSQCVHASCRRCHRILAIVISFHWNAFPPPVLSLPLSHPSPYFDSTLHFTHNEWWRARGCCAPYDDWLSRLGSLPHWYVAVATANQSTDTHSLDISFPSKVSCYGNRKPNSGSQNTERERKKKIELALLPGSSTLSPHL